MIYHSTQSDDYLWYLILRGKLEHTRIHSKVPPHFQWSEQLSYKDLNTEVKHSKINYINKKELHLYELWKKSRNLSD